MLPIAYPKTDDGGMHAPPTRFDATSEGELDGHSVTFEDILYMMGTSSRVKNSTLCGEQLVSALALVAWRALDPRWKELFTTIDEDGYDRVQPAWIAGGDSYLVLQPYQQQRKALKD